MSADVVAIIQARLGSSRLPGKVLLDIGGRPMLGWVASRAGRARSVSKVLVATTTEPADDAIVSYCTEQGIAYARGSQFDVLDRYYRAAKSANAGIIVRITADCPLLDPDLVDNVVETLLARGPKNALPTNLASNLKLSFATNRLPPPWKRTYPIGLDAEACTFEALSRAWTESTEPQQREHVMPYLYEGVRLGPSRAGVSVGLTPRGFVVAVLDHGEDLGHYRWTVDTPEDLEFVRQIYAHFRDRDDFAWTEVLELVKAQPGLTQINAAVPHKNLGDVDRRAPGMTTR